MELGSEFPRTPGRSLGAITPRDAAPATASDGTDRSLRQALG
jgi:hypothetical protein